MSGPTVRLPAVLTTERRRPEAIRRRPGAWRLAVATVCFGAFMGQLDASIVTLTYGSLRAEFHATVAAVEWVSLSYLLTLVALLVPVGRLSDAHGRKLMYLYGFVVFTAASAACGLAPGLGTLIGFRVAQAAGAAMMQANSVALVTTSAPRPKMRSALGVQAAAQALGLALGPTVGGAMVATLGWRWVFGINVPIGIVALAAGHYLLPRTRSRSSAGRFHFAGLALLATTTTAALLGISAASGLDLPGWAVGALFAVAAAAGWGFFASCRAASARAAGWDARAAPGDPGGPGGNASGGDTSTPATPGAPRGATATAARRPAAPLLDLGLLRVPAVSTGLFGALCGYLALFGPLVLVPLALADRGVPELTAGLALTALPAGFAVAATGADRCLPHGTADRTRCVLGAALCVLALAGLLAAPAALPALVPLLGVLGLGLGVFTPANNAVVMAAIPAGHSGTGGGLVNMARGLGTALGVALVTLALHLGGTGAAWTVLLAAAAAAGLGVLIQRDPARRRP